MIEIQKELCIGCGACVKDCPGKALAIEEGKAVYKRECIHCGHCVAICPVNAVSIPEYDMEEVEEYKEETFIVAPENFSSCSKIQKKYTRFSSGTNRAGKNGADYKCGTLYSNGEESSGM